MLDKVWLNIANYAIPASFENSEDIHIIKLVNLWKKYISWRSDIDADEQNFLEQAVRLQTVINVFGENNVCLSVNEKFPAKNLATNQEVSYQQCQDYIRYGMRSSQDLAINSDGGDDYLATNTFKWFAHRKTTMCGVGNVSRRMDTVILEYAQEGIEEVYIKARQTKSGLWQANISQINSLSDAQELILDTLEWSVARKEDLENAFSVQQSIPMEYEYRFFVMNQKIITGAGVVSEHTPLDNENVFDVKMRRKRDDPIEDKESKVGEYYSFVSQVVKAYAAEQPNIMNYCIDVAWSLDKVVMIERNGFSNSGLYACNIEKICQNL